MINPFENVHGHRNETTCAYALTNIHPMENHPFKVKNDEDMVALVESIRQYGVLNPIIVRKRQTGGGYEIVSGHRRYEACKRLNKFDIPVIVRDLTDEEAILTMVDANLQRERILPSEKAFAYKMKMDAIKKQGKRTDLTSDQVGPKLSADEISDTDSASQVKRYIRLTNLIPRLLALVDSGKIALGPAVELSYLSQGHQNFLSEAIEKELATPSLAQAQKLKKLEQEGKLDVATILSMVKQPKPNQVVTVKIPDDKISKYMKSNATVKEKEDFLAKAVEYYGKHLQRQKDRGAR